MTDSPLQRHYMKSSRSGGSGGNCVEWAFQSESVYIRDSKHRTGPELVASYTEWAAFLTAAGADQDHPWIERHQAGIRVYKDGHELCFTSSEWAAFIEAVHIGECAAPRSGVPLRV